MRFRFKFNVRNLCIVGVLLVCVLTLSFGIYHQIFPEDKNEVNTNTSDPAQTIVPPETDFDELIDNKINYQNYNTGDYVSKLSAQDGLVYSAYTINEIVEDKYEIRANIPIININNQKVIDIDQNILNVFYNKISEIKNNAENGKVNKTVYSVNYTACLNENILSLVIEANLKEGTNPQRVMMQSYTYNISTNEELTLKQVMEIESISEQYANEKINTGINDAINYSKRMQALGYTTYKRNINNEMYKLENSNTFFLGVSGVIYVIYPYGNTSYTSEKDIIILEKQ